MRTHRRWLMAASIAVATMPLAARQMTPAATLFQEALLLERAEGNLTAAVTRYERIVNELPPERPIVARALLQLGGAYEKLGRPEARGAYERILREYDDQTPVAREARARLGRQTAPAAAPAGTGRDAIQLYEGNDIEGDAALSPDGRYLVYSSWADNANLVLKDLTTGTSHRITTDAAVRTTGTQPWSPVFSPDGTRLAFAWLGGAERALRITDRDGGNMRTLAAGTAVDFPYAWSPDGRWLAVNLYTAGQSRLALVSVADGSIEPLISTEWQKAKVGGFSPDGRFLVYAMAAANAVPGGIFTIAVDGGTKTRIADGTAPAWTPDGGAIVFISDRSGTNDLLIQPVSDGRSRGEPKVLKRNVTADYQMFTGDGRLFYGVRSLGKNVRVASIDPTAGDAQTPALLTEKSAGLNGGAAWSPDGRQVAFARGVGADGAPLALVIRTLATGAEREMARTVGMPAQTYGMRWFADGRSLLTLGRGEARISYRKIDVHTGAGQTLFDLPLGSSARFFDLSPDDRFLYYVRRTTVPSGDAVFHVLKRDLATGRESELHTVVRALQSVRGLVVSPSGEHVAIEDTSARALLLLPTTGGTPVQLQQGAEALEPLAFTKDGRYVLGVRSGNDDRDHLWAVPVAGGAPVALNIAASNINTLSVSRADGRVAISVTESSDELWLVRNLLTPVTTR